MKAALTENQTKRFVHIWNELNGFKQGIVNQENMRYRSPGVVGWNAYDAPEVDLNQFRKITEQVTRTNL